jgi:hypothetical protein
MCSICGEDYAEGIECDLCGTSEKGAAMTTADPPSDKDVSAMSGQHQGQPAPRWTLTLQSSTDYGRVYTLWHDGKQAVLHCSHAMATDILAALNAAERPPAEAKEPDALAKTLQGIANMAHRAWEDPKTLREICERIEASAREALRGEHRAGVATSAPPDVAAGTPVPRQVPYGAVPSPPGPLAALLDELEKTAAICEDTFALAGMIRCIALAKLVAAQRQQETRDADALRIFVEGVANAHVMDSPNTGYCISANHKEEAAELLRRLRGSDGK